MNPFICITSNGGYFGRFAWCNGEPATAPSDYSADERFGAILWLQTPNITEQAWYGVVSIIRYMVLHPLRSASGR